MSTLYESLHLTFQLPCEILVIQEKYKDLIAAFDKLNGMARAWRGDPVSQLRCGAVISTTFLKWFVIPTTEKKQASSFNILIFTISNKGKHIGIS